MPQSENADTKMCSIMTNLTKSFYVIRMFLAQAFNNNFPIN